MNGTVRFELLGGSFKTDYGRDGKGRKVYYNVEKAKKVGIKEDQVLHWKGDGTPIGVIELSTSGKRVLIVDREEIDFIESFRNHEMCTSSPNKSPHAKIRFVDDEADKRATKGKLDYKKKATLVWYNLDDDDKADFAVVMGFGKDEVVIEDKGLKYIDSNPERFLTFFNEATKKEGIVRTKLKEKYRVEALLKRAMEKRVVGSEAGSIKFKDKILGSSLEIAVNNLMNSNKGDEKAFAFILPLIVEELNK